MLTSYIPDSIDLMGPLQQLKPMIYGMMLRLHKELTLCAPHVKLCQYHQALEGKEENHRYLFHLKKYKLTLYPIQSLLEFQVNRDSIIS